MRIYCYLEGNYDRMTGWIDSLMRIINKNGKGNEYEK
jgi:hypothetical protein